MLDRTNQPVPFQKGFYLMLPHQADLKNEFKKIVPSRSIRGIGKILNLFLSYYDTTKIKSNVVFFGVAGPQGRMN